MVLGNFGLFYDLYFLHDLKLTTMAFENDGYLKLNALPLSLTIYNILNKRGKWQNLNQEKISVRRKIIFKKISLLFFGANVNALRRTSLQALRNTSTNIKKWFLNLIRRITKVKLKTSCYLQRIINLKLLMKNQLVAAGRAKISKMFGYLFCQSLALQSWAH